MLSFPMVIYAWKNIYQGNRFLKQSPRKLVGIITGVDFDFELKAHRLAARNGCNCYRIEERRTGQFVMSGHNF